MFETCFALIKESHEKLEYITLFKNIEDARLALFNESRSIVICRPTYRISSINEEIIFDIESNTYIKIHIKEMEIM